MIIFQLPPTPTPFPDMSIDMPIDMPTVSLWDFADDAIQVWNNIESKSGLMTIFQLILLVGFIIGIVLAVKGLINYVTSKKSE